MRAVRVRVAKGVEGGHGRTKVSSGFFVFALNENVFFLCRFRLYLE